MYVMAVVHTVQVFCINLNHFIIIKNNEMYDFYGNPPNTKKQLYRSVPYLSTSLWDVLAMDTGGFAVVRMAYIMADSNTYCTAHKT
jgi:hypothetical protein